MKPLHVLLVSPAYRNAIGWNSTYVTHDITADIAPLSVATLAALSPADIHVDVWDELTEGSISDDTHGDKDYAFVGITGYSGHIQDVLRIASVFRKRGILTGVGGPGVSVHPHLYRDHFDVLFIGEAEETWPRFLADLRNGKYEHEYLQIIKPDLGLGAVPLWDKLDVSKYGMGAIQTTRGCPFDCEFCDVIYLFGRRMRHKPVDKVVEEFKSIAQHPYETVFFSDDEFVGDKRYAKELLRGIMPVNQALPVPKSFVTQATINASRDTELLQLATDAGFYFLYVGIETPNPENLKTVHKVQNLHKDLRAECHKIMEYGIAVRSNTIVGFDGDDTSTFDSMYEFHQGVGSPMAAVTILMAPEGTPLWRRMREEGRVISGVKKARGRFDEQNHIYQFNTIPKKMSRIELMDGYIYLLEKLNHWDAISERVRRWLSVVRRPPEIQLPRYTDTAYKNLIAGLEDRWGLEPAGRKTIDECVGYLRETAPFMWHRFKLIMTQLSTLRDLYLKSIAPSVRKRRDLEASGKSKVEADTRKPPVPRAFRELVAKLFPVVHRRVFLNLRDRSRTAEAITEVFIDFLTRWSQDLEGVNEQHIEFVAELCDRTCAKINGVAPESFFPITDSNTAVPDVTKTRLRDDILRNLDVQLGFEDAMPPFTSTEQMISQI